jgi:hypothetical protein
MPGMSATAICGAGGRSGNGAQEPDHDHHGEDDRTGALQEDLAPRQHADRHILRVRQLIGRQLHQERLGRAAPEHLAHDEADRERA